MTLTPAQIIEEMAAPGDAFLYVLGSFERRVTLWSEQHRALNLVYALHNEGMLAGRRVAIVGGGVAGLTAAAAAVQKGANVTLFERQPQLLHLLDGNHTRWVHPRIYDWPAPGSEEPNAGVPLLNWEAASAGEVADQILEAFRRSASGCRVLTGVEDLIIPPGPAIPKRLRWGTAEEDFDLVVLTIGFGIERTVQTLLPVSYWRDDGLHQPEVLPGIRSYLVSGCGDGGLTDLLRVRLARFRHENLVREFASGAELDGLKARLLEIEHALPGQPEATRLAWLDECYRSLPIPAAFDEMLRARLRRDTTAVLNGPSAYPLDPGTAVLNRVLVSRLIALGEVAYFQGRITRVERAGQGHDVHVDGQATRHFDRVVIRHGPAAAAETFSGVWEHRDIFKARAARDQTRFRIWPDGFYAAMAAPVSLRYPMVPANPSLAGRLITDVFSTRGVPRYTFIPPPEFKAVKSKLKVWGRGLIVEGPSGIGKSTTVKKALEGNRFILLNAYEPRHREQIGDILHAPFSGHLVIDNVQKLDDEHRSIVADAVLGLYESDRAAKITLIDESDTGATFIVAFPQLDNIVDIIPLRRQHDDDIALLVYTGQVETNLRFQRPEALVKAAQGSCFLAQQLCERAASIQEIEEAPAALRTLTFDLESVVGELMAELHARYEQRVRAFAAIDRERPSPGACLALLALLASTDVLPLAAAERRYASLAHTFRWLRGGSLEYGVQRQLEGLLTYEPGPGVLKLCDPRLGFYMRYVSWTGIAAIVGYQIGIGPNGDMVFA